MTEFQTEAMSCLRFVTGFWIQVFNLYLHETELLRYVFFCWQWYQRLNANSKLYSVYDMSLTSEMCKIYGFLYLIHTLTS